MTEPAQPSQVGSVVIASLHGGIGRGLDEGILKYKQGTSIDLTIPSEVIPGYNLQTVSAGPVNMEAPDVVYARPTFAWGNGAGNGFFILAGQKIWGIDPVTNDLIATVITGSFPPTSELSGSSFQYNETLVFGVISNDDAGVIPLQGKPVAYGTAALSNLGAATLTTTKKISYGASSRGRAFWIEEDSQLRWAPSVTGAAFKGGGTYKEFPATGPGIELGFPRMSWLAMVGAALLYFRRDGAIIGGDETGLLSIAGQVPVGGIDFHFGRRSTPYHDGVLIPTQQGLWSFDMRSLTMRPASLNYIQGQADERLRGEPTAVASAGPYAFVALRQVDSAGVVTNAVYTIVRYADRIAVHDLLPSGTFANNVVVTDLLTYYDADSRQTRLYLLTFNESTTVISVRWLPLRLPNDQAVDDTDVVTTASVALSPIAGPSPAANMTKLWVQVRGYFDKGSGAGSPVLSFSGITIDNLAVALASVTTTGPFVRSFTATPTSRLVGRELTALTVTITDGNHDTRLALPLTVDFIWVPSSQDAVSLRALVSGEVSGKVAALWRESPWGTAKELLDLRGTVVDLEFPEGDTWSVFVEQVGVDDTATPEGAGQTARVATIQVRRLS